MDIKELNESLNEYLVSDDYFTDAELQEISRCIREGEGYGYLGDAEYEDDNKFWTYDAYVVGNEGEDGDLAWLCECLRNESIIAIANSVEEGNVEEFINLSFVPKHMSDKLSCKATAKEYPHLVKEDGKEYFWTIKFMLSK